MQPSDFLIGPLSSDPNFCLSWPRASPPSSDGLDWQLGTFDIMIMHLHSFLTPLKGQVFMRTVYSVFRFV